MRVLAKDILEGKVTGEAEVSGWVHRIRDMGGITFVILRDRSGILQLVFEKKPDLTLESVISVKGTPAANEKAPGGTELRVSGLEVLSKAAPELPFQVNGDVSKTGLESILDNRLLSLRNPKIRSIFNIQATIVEAFAGFLRNQDFTEIKTSKLVSTGTEGGTNLFQVEYFDDKICLAQSPQFYKETLVAAGMERVFEIGQVYRAEKHDTPRHLNEYVSLDVEVGFIESEKDLIELEKGVLAHIFAELERKNKKDLDAWNATVPSADAVAKAPTVPYDECLSIVNAEAAKGKNPGGRIFDINPEAERIICEWSLKENGVDLVFVNQFPRRHRPFYTYPLDLGDGKASSTMSFDAIFRGLEITSGSRRHHDYQAFLEALPRFGLKTEDMGGYLELLKYGCPPHGGFAIGCERLTQKVLGLTSVKEASLFPRDRKRVAP
ncbi:aspartyl-tRNA synthetase (Aspartate--tRNA ligase)(AspRS) [Treponema primitia ZAS-2]|uniref:Aspartate--tRNA(Asp/Asn) ligase n=1 Tax=Treponema primitia (strain ATCC BAA-887 / DSM 12427 / ZAS-2) TaxID=545694 RepID=F5YQY8_TREPZ|nr:aspartate--tRNA(Asn) ligase [Treponema primitia]AEF86158.1 aspartyl-tRNA synthetase (Aspartate--tRNA ligase)(AspRS) [Treponema primitia ZAS-2]